VQNVTYDDANKEPKTFSVERETKQTAVALDTRNVCECFEGECTVEGSLTIIPWQCTSVCNPKSWVAFLHSVALWVMIERERGLS